LAFARFLPHRKIRFFDYPTSAEPFRNKLRENAERLAAEAGIEILVSRTRIVGYKDPRTSVDRQVCYSYFISFIHCFVPFGALKLALLSFAKVSARVGTPFDRVFPLFRGRILRKINVLAFGGGN